MNRLPSPRCASVIQIVRPSQSKADTQPQLHPAFLRLSAMISHYFTPRAFCLFCSPQGNDKMICTVAKMRTTFAIAMLLIPLFLPAATCLELPGDASWSEQEHWVWNQVCAGREANLQQQYGGNLTSEQGENWPPQPDLSERFLKTILSDDIYRSRIPDQGVKIVGARFREKIDLSHSQLKHDLWL